MKIYHRCSPELAEKILDEGFTDRALGIEGSLSDHGVTVTDHPYRRLDDAGRKMVLEFELRPSECSLANATVSERPIGCHPSDRFGKRTHLRARLVRVSWLRERICDVRVASKPVLLMYPPATRSTDERSQQRTVTR
jgi:hypothetical protein